MYYSKKIPLFCWFDHFLCPRAEICQIFHWFFGNFKVSKRHSEINGPLVLIRYEIFWKRVYFTWKTHVSSRGTPRAGFQQCWGGCYGWCGHREPSNLVSLEKRIQFGHSFYIFFHTTTCLFRKDNFSWLGKMYGLFLGCFTGEH